MSGEPTFGIAKSQEESILDVGTQEPWAVRIEKVLLWGWGRGWSPALHMKTETISFLFPDSSDLNNIETILIATLFGQ